MRIQNLCVIERPETVRWQAEVVWEIRRAETETLFFESAALDRTRANPLSFLIAMLPQAWWAQEERVVFEADMSTVAVDDLLAALTLYQAWMAPRKKLPAVECRRTDGALPVPPPGRQTGLFLSGGVDSMSALADNHRRYPVGDPRRVRHAFFVSGFDINIPYKPPQADFYERAAQQLDEAVAPRGVQLHRVYTNLRDRSLMPAPWEDVSVGFALAAAAHCFDGVVNRCLIAADYPAATVSPCGTHPSVIPLLGTHALVISVEQVEYSRHRKIERLREDHDLLKALRVCWVGIDESNPLVNCGRCHKCVMTMLSLLVVGALEKAGQFGTTELRPEDLCPINENKAGSNRFLIEIEQQVRQIGRDDLADVLVRKIRKNRRSGPRAVLKRLGKRLGGGRV